jgi:D-psicose/D-tagatose/L-ribulose 3-epimerase
MSGPLRFGYNTNGLQNHRLEDAVELVRDAGYDGVALTLDIHHLDPFAPRLEERAEALRERLGGLGTVVETGARFLLDPRLKHEPTLVSPAGRARRVDFLRRACDVAAVLGSECVSLWSGVPGPDVARADAWDWFRAGLEEVRAHAARRGVVVAVEPEPGMLVETLDDFLLLDDDLPLALDVGHLLVTGEREPAAAVREFAERLGTVAVEDMRRGEHVHLPFGECDLDLPPVLAALAEVGFGGLVCVELSRDSHRAHTMVPDALAALRAAAPAGPAAPAAPAPGAARP